METNSRREFKSQIPISDSGIPNKAFQALSESARKAGLIKPRADAYAEEVLGHLPDTLCGPLTADTSRNISYPVFDNANNVTADKIYRQDGGAYEGYAKAKDIRLGIRIWFKIPLRALSIEGDANATMDDVFFSGRVQYMGLMGKTDASFRVGVVLDSLNTSATQQEKSLYQRCLSFGSDGTYIPRNIKTHPNHSINNRFPASSVTPNHNNISSNNRKYFDCEHGRGFYLKENECYQKSAANRHDQQDNSSNSGNPSIISKNAASQDESNDDISSSLSSFSSLNLKSPGSQFSPLPSPSNEFIDNGNNTSPQYPNNAQNYKQINANNSDRSFDEAPREELRIGDRVAIKNSDPVAKLLDKSNLFANNSHHPNNPSNYSSMASDLNTLSDSVVNLTETGEGRNMKAGIVRYIGPIDVSPGCWVGVELDLNLGKNDGRVKNKRYFKCKPNYGIFVKLEKVVKLPQDNSNIYHKISDNFNTFRNDLVLNRRTTITGACLTAGNRNRFYNSTLHLARMGSQESLASEASFMSLNPSNVRKTPSSSSVINNARHRISMSQKNPMYDNMATKGKDDYASTLMMLRMELDKCLKCSEGQKVEINRLTTLMKEKSEQFDCLNQDYVNFKQNSEEKISFLHSQIEDFEKQNDDLENKFKEEQQKREEAEFQLEEMSIMKDENNQNEKCASKSDSMGVNNTGEVISEEVFVDLEEDLILNENIREKDEKIQTLYTENDSLKSKIEKLENDWIELNNERQSLMLANYDLQKAMNSQKSANVSNDLEQRNTELVAIVENMRKGIEKLNEEILEKNTKMIEMEKVCFLQVKEINEQKEELANKCLKAQANIDLCHQNFTELEGKCHIYEKKIEANNADSNRRYEELKSQLFEEMQVKLNLEAQKLKRDRSEENRAYQDKIKQLEAINAETLEKFVSTSQKMERLDQNYQMKDKELQDFFSINAGLNEEIERIQRELERTEGLFFSLNEEKTERDSELDDLKATIDKQESMIQALRSTNEKLSEKDILTKENSKDADLNGFSDSFKEDIDNLNMDSAMGDFKNLAASLIPENYDTIHKQCNLKQEFLNAVIIGMNEQLGRLNVRLDEMKMLTEESNTRLNNGDRDSKIYLKSNSSDEDGYEFVSPPRSPSKRDKLLSDESNTSNKKHRIKLFADSAELLFNKSLTAAAKKVKADALAKRPYCDECQIFDSHETAHCQYTSAAENGRLDDPIFVDGVRNKQSPKSKGDLWDFKGVLAKVKGINGHSNSPESCDKISINGKVVRNGSCDHSPTKKRGTDTVKNGKGMKGLKGMWRGSIDRPYCEDCEEFDHEPCSNP
ncbi:unnamed protein product [Gordionus sp. m RMFG-2023]|uniref:CAP-Gly domain-containing linker protein 1-like n=1 Tax=Gordionus sp. m RMFG-2023 TaxID=3053472 RepID=UPI0030E576F0